MEGKLPGVSGERPDVAEHPAGAQRPKFLLTARPCEPSVGGDGRRRRAPTDAAAVGVMWRAWEKSIVRISADRPLPSLYIQALAALQFSTVRARQFSTVRARIVPSNDYDDLPESLIDTSPSPGSSASESLFKRQQMAIDPGAGRRFMSNSVLEILIETLIYSQLRRACAVWPSSQPDRPTPPSVCAPTAVSYTHLRAHET